MSVLSDYVDVIMGQAPSGDQYNDRGEGWPLIAGAGDFAGSVPRPKKYTITASKLSRPGDIVIGIRASIGSKVWSDGEYCLGRGVAALRPRETVDGSYVWHWFEANRTLLESKARGATFLQVNRADIAELPFEPPPLPEQRRIASILDLASSITAKCDAQKDLFREASSAIFMSMFGDPLLTSRHALAVPLSTVTEAIIDCPHTTPTWTDTGLLCLRTSNLGLGEWDFSETRFVSEETHEVRTRRAVLKAGDLILSREGTLGVGAIVEPDMEASMGQRLVQIRPDTELVLPEFLLAYLLVVLQPSRLTQLLVGSTSRHLNVRDIRALPIDVPSIDRQREFSEAVRAIRVQRRSVDIQTILAAELLQAVQDRAFRGEL